MQSVRCGVAEKTGRLDGIAMDGSWIFGIGKCLLGLGDDEQTRLTELNRRAHHLPPNKSGGSLRWYLLGTVQVPKVPGYSHLYHTSVTQHDQSCQCRPFRRRHSTAADRSSSCSTPFPLSH